VAVATVCWNAGRDVNLRLGYQQLPARLEQAWISPAGVVIGDFVDHHDRPGRNRLGIDAQTIPLALVKLDASARPLAEHAPQHIEHLLLEIYDDHRPWSPTSFAMAIENIPCRTHVHDRQLPA